MSNSASEISWWVLEVFSVTNFINYLHLQLRVIDCHIAFYMQWHSIAIAFYIESYDSKTSPEGSNFFEEGILTYVSQKCFNLCFIWSKYNSVYTKIQFWVKCDWQPATWKIFYRLSKKQLATNILNAGARPDHSISNDFKYIRAYLFLQHSNSDKKKFLWTK